MRILISICIAALASFALFGEVSLVGTCPAEDSSSALRIVWHSDSPACELLFGPEGAEPKVVAAEKAKTPVEYTGKTDYWRYRAEVKSLEPGTRYAYEVHVPGGESVSRSARTAPKDGDFDFLWIGDIHSTPSRPDKIASVDRLLSHAEEMSSKRGGISFVLCTGDAVKHGQTYACWREWDRSRVMRDYMTAMIPGNKEYYRSEGKTRWHDRWFSNALNNPENGAPGLAGTYWFLYGGVLFAGIDTLAVEGAEMDRSVRETSRMRQRDWLERVAKEQKGRYRFFVVFQHYPYFRKSGPCSYGGYEFWRGTFDALGVDFALSGDEHAYARTHPLRGGERNASGTVYVVCPKIDSRMEEPRIVSGEGLVASCDENGSSYGACLFSVSGEEMTMRYISPAGAVRDTVGVRPRQVRRDAQGGPSLRDGP